MLSHCLPLPKAMAPARVTRSMQVTRGLGMAGSTTQQPLVRIDLRESSVLEVGDLELGGIGEEAEGEEAQAMNHQAQMPHKLAADANHDTQ